MQIVALKSIDERERQALASFDTRRRTLAGRAIDIIKGRHHYDRQRKDITDRHEAERMSITIDDPSLATWLNLAAFKNPATF